MKNKGWIDPDKLHYCSPQNKIDNVVDIVFYNDDGWRLIVNDEYLPANYCIFCGEKLE